MDVLANALNILGKCSILMLATVLYLVIDLYPVVKSFRFILTTGSFWLLSILMTVLNILAFAALSITAEARLKELVGAQFTALALVTLSTLGTIGVLQSLTLKIADYKMVDLGELVDGLRRGVLADIARISADRRRSQALTVADRLFAKHGENVTVLRDEFASIMSFTDQTRGQVGEELTKLEIESREAHLSFPKALALRIAQIDLERAERLANSLAESEKTKDNYSVSAEQPAGLPPQRN